MTSKQLVVGLLAGIPVLQGWCEKQEPAGAAIVVLFDFSQSTRDPGTRQAYCEDFRRVAARIKHGDALAAAAVTERSAAELRLIVDTVFPRFDPRTDNRYLREARQRQADSLLALRIGELDSLVCQKLSQPPRLAWQTDIMGSLDLATRIFRRVQSGEKILVIMSDMIEDSERYDFDRIPLDRAAVERILRQEAEAGRVPDLAGVEVCVAGAYAGTSRRYQEIERFWRAYFARAGARLVSYAGPLLGCAT